MLGIPYRAIGDVQCCEGIPSVLWEYHSVLLRISSTVKGYNQSCWGYHTVLLRMSSAVEGYHPVLLKDIISSVRETISSVKDIEYC